MHRQGALLKETYKVEKRLSGPKIAYQATHVGLGTTVVVELVSDQAGVESLDIAERKERKKDHRARLALLKSLAAVHHPGLAKIIDTFALDEQHYLVREWAPGLTLRALLEDSLKPLSQSIAEDLADQLLSLLDELDKSLGPIAVGTLCPDYLVVNSEGCIRLIDYGLGVYQPGQKEYEPFASPEFLSGGDRDQRSDLYSLGAVLYFAVTGSELPPLWNRITCSESIPEPVELGAVVDGRFWATLESLVSLSLEERPETVNAARDLLRNGEFVETAISSPATWYPELSGLFLADSYPFAPFSKPDWILKVVQAAVAGHARGLAVVQNRDSCRLDLQFAAVDVPSPQALVDALTTDGPIGSPMVAELAAGLRMVGEFRDFRVTLDDWRRSWTLRCLGGRITTESGPSGGRAGLVVDVPYEGASSDRARQAADELIRLVRKTRLCQVPITIGRKPLEPGRGVDISELSKEVVEVYLASASLPEKGGFRLTREPETRETDQALTSFAPAGNRAALSHVDIRCYVAPGQGTLDSVSGQYQFLRRSSRLLWYRRGVLCAESYLEKKLPLQLDIHINGDHLEADNSGLKLLPPDWVQVARLHPLREAKRILAIVRVKLQDFWDDNPTEANPKAQALVGMLGAPALLMFFSGLVGPGLILLKKAAGFALLKSSSAAGALIGYATASDQEEKVRKACLKAMEAFDKEDLS